MTDAPLPVNEQAGSALNSIVMVAAFGQNGRMKHLVALFATGLALAACAPLSIYYRPDVSVARLQTDQTNCEVSALRDAPVANQVRERPPIYFPGRQICGPGGCYQSGGYWVEGGLYTVDVNRGLRSRVEAQCMARKGYQPITVPLCNPAVKSAVPPGQTRILPKLTETACSIRHSDGSWQIVNPIISKQGG